MLATKAALSQGVDGACDDECCGFAASNEKLYLRDAELHRYIGAV